jgi:2-methylisocitrate lyase-like PEP mutase family enzyme
MFLSGFGFAASYYGLPDIGFIAWPDMVSFVQRLRLAFPQQHLLVDIGLFAVEGVGVVGASLPG